VAPDGANARGSTMARAASQVRPPSLLRANIVCPLPSRALRFHTA
jgi:hypothetical protein